MPHVTRSSLAGPTWGTITRPVRTNLPYSGNPRGQLLTNLPDSWELEQYMPVSWFADVADDGTPPAWWEGRAVEDGWSAIGPHGPWIVGAFAAVPVVHFLTKLVVDPLTRFDIVDPDNPQTPQPVPVWLRDPQLLRPDDRVNPQPLLPLSWRLPAATFWRDLVVCALWYGRSYLYFVEDESGQPLAGSLIVLTPQMVTADGGDLYIGDPVDGIRFGRDGRRADGAPGRLLMLRNPDNPFGVFWAFPDVFRISRKVSRYTEGTFTAGVPSGYLKVTNPAPITQEQADDLKQRWMAAHGGDRRTVAVLNAYTEYQPIQYSPNDASLADVKRLNYADVAFAFGVAPALIGTSVMAGGGTMTYANLEQWWEQRRDVTLPTWLAAVEQTLSSLIPGTRQVRVDLDEYTYGSFSDRIEQYAAGKAAGLDPAWLADRLGLIGAADA